MEVDPIAYFNISDQVSGGIYMDPILKEHKVTRKGKKHTDEELVEKMWSQGAYNFRFEIIYSNSSQPTIIYVPVYPSELWNFNIEKSRKRGHLFRKRRYIYKIDPKKFTPKRVDLSKKKISLGKWDLSKEAAERYIRIFEEDKSQTTTETIEYETTRFNSTKINGSVKFGLGTDFVTGNVSTDANTSTTIKETRKYELSRKEEDDALGTIKIYFYDPIVEKHVKNSLMYKLHEYNTGVVSLTITADFTNR